MNREKGEIIEAHIHNEVNRELARTQEGPHCKEWEKQVDLYSGENKYWGSFMLGAGDLVFWRSGAMASQCLKRGDALIKLGPYLGDQDKVRFARHHGARPEDQSRFQSADPYLTAERKNCSHGV